MNAPIGVYILAGGKSSRFGSDKARAITAPEGHPLICRIADVVRSWAEPIIIADRADRYADLGLKTIGDLTPGLGPMGGVQTALHHCPHEWLLLVSCDLVHLEPAWIESLLRARQEQTDIVAFRGEYWEPLCALYHAHLLPEVDRRVARHELALQALLNAVHTQKLPRPAGWTDANTPEQLAHSAANTFTILLFGPLADAAGCRQICATVASESPTCADLRKAITDQHPSLTKHLPSCRFAVNQAFAAEDRPVRTDQEIALIGLVCGG